MSDPYFNRSRQGKIQQLGYDEIITNPHDTRSCSICVQRNEAEALLAALEPLGWTSRWYSSSDGDIDKDAVEAFVAGIRNKLMSDCCGDQTPDLIRIGDDGTLEGSDNGGLDWIEVPSADDFRFTGTLYPPLSEEIENKKCQGAGQTVDVFKRTQHDFSTTLSQGLPWAILIASIATGLLFWFSLPFLGTIAIMIAGMLGVLLSLTDEEFDALFTEEVWDEWLCLVYCNIGDAAAWDETLLTNLLADLDASEVITDPARIFFNVLVRLWWVVGMTNAARTVTDTAYDCSECDCSSCHLHIGNYGGNTAYGTFDGVFSGKYRYSAQAGGDGYYYLSLISDSEADCCDILAIDNVSGYTPVLWGVTDCAHSYGQVTNSDPLTAVVGPIKYMARQFSGAVTVDITYG